MDPLPKETTEGMFRSWLYPARRGENAWIVWTPRSDRSRRIEQLLGSEKAIPLFRVSLVLNRIEDPADWESFLGAQTIMDMQRVFCIEDAEVLLQDRPWLLAVFSRHYLQHPRCSFLFFSERFPYEVTQPDLIQNILFQSTYSEFDALHFCRYLDEKFSLRLPLREKRTIIRACGGLLWLIKHLYRLRTQMPLSMALTHPSLIWRVEQVYSSLSAAEKKALQGLAWGRSVTASAALATLQSLSITDGKKIYSNLLCELISRSESSRPEIRVEHGRVFLGSLDAQAVLGERIVHLLVLLWKRNGSLISRPEMADLFGLSTEAVYSDWALDQAVRRLRKTLSKYQIPAQTLRTVRGKGYLVDFYDS